MTEKIRPFNDVRNCLGVTFLDICAWEFWRLPKSYTS